MWACDSINRTATTANPDRASPHKMWHDGGSTGNDNRDGSGEDSDNDSRTTSMRATGRKRPTIPVRIAATMNSMTSVMIVLKTLLRTIGTTGILLTRTLVRARIKRSQPRRALGCLLAVRRPGHPPGRAKRRLLTATRLARYLVIRRGTGAKAPAVRLPLRGQLLANSRRTSPTRPVPCTRDLGGQEFRGERMTQIKSLVPGLAPTSPN